MAPESDIFMVSAGTDLFGRGLINLQHACHLSRVLWSELIIIKMTINSFGCYSGQSEGAKNFTKIPSTYINLWCSWYIL